MFTKFEKRTIMERKFVYFSAFQPSDWSAGDSSLRTNDRISERHAERSEASLEDQKMINIIINSTSRDPSCLGMTPNLMSLPLSEHMQNVADPE
jgi:hypothetical protein